MSAGHRAALRSWPFLLDLAFLATPKFRRSEPKVRRTCHSRSHGATYARRCIKSREKLPPGETSSWKSTNLVNARAGQLSGNGKTTSGKPGRRGGTERIGRGSRGFDGRTPSRKLKRTRPGRRAARGGRHPDVRGEGEDRVVSLSKCRRCRHSYRYCDAAPPTARKRSPLQIRLLFLASIIDAPSCPRSNTWRRDRLVHLQIITYVLNL